MKRIDAICVDSGEIGRKSFRPKKKQQPNRKRDSGDNSGIQFNQIYTCNRLEMESHIAIAYGIEQ